MGFKVASRVRGLSDEAFREAFGHRGAVPLGAGPAALAGRLRLPLLRPSGALRAGRSGTLSMQPVQEADIAHGRHDLPRDQAAADTLVHSHPPDRDGEERHLVSGTRPPSRGQAADGLDREAQDHGRDGAAQRGDAAVGAGGDGQRLSWRGALRQQGTRRSAISRARSPGSIASSAPTMPNATSSVSLDAINTRQ